MNRSAGIRPGREVAQEALTTAQAALPRPATAGRDGDALLLGANGQPVWGRLTSGTVSPWAALEAAPAPRWIAHRGAALLAPENTIEAFRAASALNADAIELDVYKVADGSLFCMHDTTVDRTSNLSGNTASLTTPAALRGRIDSQLVVRELVAVGSADPAVRRRPRRDRQSDPDHRALQQQR
ncbi:glycerophosphodiester phosphodiesterase family protein [Streptomyces sp. UP1A-1]|nr:glycerophosphodiester phosphodiesterase family protein [Streptomyces sp. UP1A-1]